MNDETRRGLRQLLPPLKTLAGMVERAYETEMHKGTGNMAVKSYRNQHSRIGTERRLGQQLAPAHHGHPGDETVGKIQVVGRQHDDGPARCETLQPLRHETHSPIVEAGERFVEQHQRGRVQESPLEREALPHAT